MKFFLLSFAVCLAAYPQSKPTIGIIDFYGARAVSHDRLLKELKVKEGDPIPPSKGLLEEQLVALKGVLRANVEAVCCDKGKAIFYVGVEERGGVHLDVREEPTNEKLELPAKVSELYEKLIVASGEAMRSEDVREDWSLGYSLMVNNAAREVQLQLPELAEANLAILRQILRESADGDARAIAATILGYAPKDQSVIEDLQFAMRDPEQTVRANALRSLAPLALYSREKPEMQLRVQTTWFVEMLNSVAWQDRMSAMSLLLELTSKPDEKLIRHLKERGVPALIEMALWKHLPHALPAYMLLGRVAGMEESEIQSTWSANAREETIKKMRKRLKV